MSRTVSKCLAPVTMYNGQTSQHISTGVSKLERDTKQANHLSVITRHSAETRPSVDFDTGKIIDIILNSCLHIITEELDISIEYINKDGLTS
jgi:hypothetical protein